MSKSWEGGSTRGWRETRAAVLLRDGGLCTIQIPLVCTHVATCVHHTQGRSTTGDDPAYLASACEPCNLHIGDPQANADPPTTPITEW